MIMAPADGITIMKVNSVHLTKDEQRCGVQLLDNWLQSLICLIGSYSENVNHPSPKTDTYCILISQKYYAQSRDVHETFQAETETRPETQRSETETRPRRWAFCPRRDRDRDRDRDVEGPRRDRDRDVPAPETLAETCGEKLSTTKSTELVNTLYLWCCEILLLVHYVHCVVLLQYVRPSVCSPCVTLRYRGHISWATSKVITLRSSLLGAPTSSAS